MHSSAQMEKMLGVLYTLPQSAWVFQDRMLGVCNREACVNCHRRTYDDTNDEFTEPLLVADHGGSLGTKRLKHRPAFTYVLPTH